MMDALRRWPYPRWAIWPALYAALVLPAALIGWLWIGVGNAMFVAGALTILASMGFIGTGGERRFRLIRNIFGVPIGSEQLDPEKRDREISTGVKVFFLGLAIWAPLLVIVWREI